MKIKTALILCAGFGKRLNPLTLKTPKPLIELGNETFLEKCIKTVTMLGVKKILLNTFYLGDQITKYIKSKNFAIDIEIISDGKEILDTGGGILNMIENSNDENFIVFNPDTLWSSEYLDEISKMQDLFFSKKLNNILLLTKKELSFDQNLNGDFKLDGNLLKKTNENNFIYIGCQILSKNLFKKYKVKRFPISLIWNELLRSDNLNGYESLNKFYHLTSLDIFKKLKDL